MDADAIELLHEVIALVVLRFIRSQKLVQGLPYLSANARNLGRLELRVCRRLFIFLFSIPDRVRVSVIGLGDDQLKMAELLLAQLSNNELFVRLSVGCATGGQIEDRINIPHKRLGKLHAETLRIVESRSIDQLNVIPQQRDRRIDREFLNQIMERLL